MGAILSMSDITVPPAGGYLGADCVFSFPEQIGDVIRLIVGCFAEIRPFRLQFVIAYAAVFHLVSYPLSVDKQIIDAQSRTVDAGGCNLLFCLEFFTEHGYSAHVNLQYPIIAGTGNHIQFTITSHRYDFSAFKSGLRFLEILFQNDFGFFLVAFLFVLCQYDIVKHGRFVGVIPSECPEADISIR